MAENVLMILINCVILALVLCILYWIIKKAVKNGILEAYKEIKQPQPKVKYPIKIDEDHPDLPFNEE